MNGIISANTLFHFTDKKENLLGIIEHGFYPRYCMENIRFFPDSGKPGVFPATELAIPMVCFCDIPLSQIGRHTAGYGGYALGMSKEWGKSKGINPVMYELSDSNPITAISSSINELFQYIQKQAEKKEKLGRIKNIGDKLAYFSCFIKPYEGHKWNPAESRFNGERTRFYDEREWRYVPGFDSLSEEQVTPCFRKDQYLHEQTRNQGNDKLKELFKLSFLPADLKFIIVKTEAEVLEIARSVIEIKGMAGYGEDEKRLLLTKIISLDRLKEDV